MIPVAPDEDVPRPTPPYFFPFLEIIWISFLV
jgi:hypothetical protein